MRFHHSRRAVKTMTPMAMIDKTATTEGIKMSRCRRSGSTDSRQRRCGASERYPSCRGARAASPRQHQHVQVGSIDS